MRSSDPGPSPDRTFRRAIRATRTRAFATTAVDPKSFEQDEDRPTGPLDRGDLPQIGDIVRAIEALHVAGLRHQDIKPDNIFLATFAGRLHPVLLDLGVAAEKDSSFIAGTALFAAPEQLLAIIGVPGAIPLSEKMDTYTF